MRTVARSPASNQRASWGDTPRSISSEVMAGVAVSRRSADVEKKPSLSRWVVWAQVSPTPTRATNPAANTMRTPATIIRIRPTGAWDGSDGAPRGAAGDGVGVSVMAPCSRFAAGRVPAEGPDGRYRSGRDDARRTPGIRPRRPPADRQLRRPGVVPRRQRRRLRGAARRDRHQRHPDGPLPLVARRRRPLPGRGRRACTSRSTASGTSTAGARSPTSRRSSTATAASPAPSPTCGTTPTSTRCARELRAQIERAILWGFDVSHLDSHMGTLQLKPEFFDVYLELAVEFRLPLRLSGGIDRTDHRVPVPPARRRGGRALPRPLPLRAGRGSRRADRAGRLRPAARRHRGLRPSRRRHPGATSA